MFCRGYGELRAIIWSPFCVFICYRRYGELRAIIDELWPAAQRPRVIGPDLNTRPDWLARFLAALPAADTVDGVSFHMYPGYGRSLNLPSLILQPGWLVCTLYPGHHLPRIVWPGHGMRCKSMNLF